MSDDKTPSSRARDLERAREAAQDEVDRHLAAGRPVYGRQDGKPVWVHVSRLELAQQVMDWEGPARP
jgi:hypothetical protein